MDSLLLSWALSVGIALAGAVFLGHFLQRGCGIFLFTVATLASAGICYLGASLYGWIGVLIAVLVLGVGAIFVGRKIGGSRAARLASLLWFGIASSALVGYWIGYAPGVLVVSSATTVFFWITLYVLSGYLLPLQDPSERSAAFRSLLTFSLGTNFPYYVMKDRELEERVGGKPYRSLFAGPGIVITGCDHIVVLTNGVNLRVAQAPGLVFTERFEVIQRVVDLRPQLRSFYVEAHTLDGIAVRVLTFVPFRVDWGGAKPELGEPFPLQREAIFRAVRSELVEQEQDHKRNWDDLVEIHATRIMRDIICRYKFDDLCLATGAMVENRPEDDDIVERYRDDEQPADRRPRQDPRGEIRDELVKRLTEEMDEFGIEVIGGGISNLLPLDRAVIKRRIENWRTKWQNRMVLVEADREARKTRLREQARNAVERELLVAASDMLCESLARGQDMSDELLAAAVVASLERMAANPNVKQLLPGEALPKLAFLRAQGRDALAAPATKGAGE